VAVVQGRINKTPDPLFLEAAIQANTEVFDAPVAYKKAREDYYRADKPLSTVFFGS